MTMTASQSRVEHLVADPALFDLAARYQARRRRVKEAEAELLESTTILQLSRAALVAERARFEFANRQLWAELDAIAASYRAEAA